MRRQIVGTMLILVGMCLIFGTIIIRTLPKTNSDVIDRTYEIESFALYSFDDYYYGLRFKDDDNVCVHIYPVDRTQLIVNDTIKHSRIHIINFNYSTDYDYVIYLSIEDLENNQELFKKTIDRLE